MKNAWVPTLAVAAVAIVAVLAVVMVKRSESESRLGRASAEAPSISVPASGTPRVVQAPPLRSAASAMGSAAACRNCGTVELVVALKDPGRPEPRAFQMHIRMDDGSVRTVEQRGALPAGSRVVVERGSVKVIMPSK
jgi:hypothetical protein